MWLLPLTIVLLLSVALAFLAFHWSDDKTYQELVIGNTTGFPLRITNKHEGIDIICPPRSTCDVASGISESGLDFIIATPINASQPVPVRIERRSRRFTLSGPVVRNYIEY
jgi:hypothetical protein